MNSPLDELCQMAADEDRVLNVSRSAMRGCWTIEFDLKHERGGNDVQALAARMLRRVYDARFLAANPDAAPKEPWTYD